MPSAWSKGWLLYWNPLASKYIATWLFQIFWYSFLFRMFLQISCPAFMSAARKSPFFSWFTRMISSCVKNSPYCLSMYFISNANLHGYSRWGKRPMWLTRFWNCTQYWTFPLWCQFGWPPSDELLFIYGWVLSKTFFCSVCLQFLDNNAWIIHYGAYFYASLLM